MQKYRVLGHVLGLVLATMTFASDVTFPQEKLERKNISLCGKKYRAWLATTDEDRARGLMSFRKLTSTEAMLFIFEDERPLSFWMKNVSLDLDIAYFDRNKKLVSYTTMKATSPLMREASLPQYPSAGPAQYAVEVQAGALKKLKKGCPLTF